jgi:cyanophycinase
MKRFLPFLGVLVVVTGLHGEEPDFVPPKLRIDPAGIGGRLLLVGDAAPNSEMLAKFVELGGKTDAAIVVLRVGKADTDDRTWQTALKEVTAKHGGEDPRILTADAIGEKRVTGIWLVGEAKDDVARKVCRDFLARGGIIGAAGPSVALAESDQLDLLPDSSFSPQAKAEARHVVYRIGEKTALYVDRRTLSVFGEGNVHLSLAAAAGRPARSRTLQGKDLEDLTALRRDVRDRQLPEFPAKKMATPEVPKGTLFIVGGGGMPAGMRDRFIEAAGGPEKASIVVLPTAQPDPLPSSGGGFAAALKKSGIKKVTVLPGRTLSDVDSEKSLAALKTATGIWFDGGRQWRFVDAYEGTKAVELMHDVLRRGGAIAGSSAGATIQGEFLCRGGPFENFAIHYPGYERSLGFLPGVGIDQHFSQRKRAGDMARLIKNYPQMLGIGIDETTALVVRGHVGEVAGQGKVFFFDGQRPAAAGEPSVDSLSAGGRYDLKARRVLKAD